MFQKPGNTFPFNENIEWTNYNASSFSQDFDGVSVEYETFPGWKSSIASCKDFAELPENAKAYVLRIEELLGVPGEKECHEFLKYLSTSQRKLATLVTETEGIQEKSCLLIKFV